MEERRHHARLEMNDVRARIGRITPAQKAFLSIHDPQLLQTVLSMQAQLGQSANMQVNPNRPYYSQSFAYV
jgi:hypothetical protein